MIRLAEKMTPAMKKRAEDNIGLVGYMVSRLCLNPCQVEDAYAAGSLGLCKAALSWKKGVGPAFSSYACHLIKHEILDALRAGGAMRRAAVPLEDADLFPSQEKGFIAAENRSLIETICQNPDGILSEDELEVVLRLLRGGKIKGIAAAMGEKGSAVYLLRAKAAAKLRIYFQKGL